MILINIPPNQHLNIIRSRVTTSKHIFFYIQYWPLRIFPQYCVMSNEHIWKMFVHECCGAHIIASFRYIFLCVHMEISPCEYWTFKCMAYLLFAARFMGGSVCVCSQNHWTTIEYSVGSFHCTSFVREKFEYWLLRFDGFVFVLCFVRSFSVKFASAIHICFYQFGCVCNEAWEAAN